MTGHASPATPGRAKRACRVCNRRRVRCNALERFPCENCIAANTTCELLESNRGKHLRKKVARDGIAPLSYGRDTDEAQLIRHSATGDAGQTRNERHAPQPEHNGLAAEQDKIQQEPRDAVYSDSSHRYSPMTCHDSLTQDDGAVYLGESTSLRVVHDQRRLFTSNNSSPYDNSKLYYPISDDLKSTAAIPSWEAERRDARLQYLRSTGAFTIPEDSVCSVLLRSYFQWFHPCFPILNRVETVSLYRSKNLSPLLLQSILFVGLMHSDIADLEEIGLSNRQEAKYMFYNHAKDIYDADYETNKLTVLQAVFLLSFWRAGPLLEKDTRHWLGAAISLAQTKAMHRSLVNDGSDPFKLRKRIWWSIYIRDRQCSSALGLPNRIRDEDCDIEPLDTADVQETEFLPPCDILCSQYSEHISYFIEMAKLAKLLGKVVHKGYLPKLSLTTAERSRLKEDLNDWERNLPSTMRISASCGYDISLHVAMLHLAYNNLLILLYRAAYTENKDGPVNDGHIAFQAACSNARIIENMLANGIVHHGQVHLITSIFNTLCMHTVNLRRSTGTARNVAEHRAKLCLLGLSELQKTWEVTNWVLQLFFKFLDRSVAKRLQIDDEQPASSPKGGTCGSSTTSRLPLPQYLAHPGEWIVRRETTDGNGRSDRANLPNQFNWNYPVPAAGDVQRGQDSAQLADVVFDEAVLEHWMVDANPAQFNGLSFQDFGCLATIYRDRMFT